MQKTHAHNEKIHSNNRAQIQKHMQTIKNTNKQISTHTTNMQSTRTKNNNILKTTIETDDKMRNTSKYTIP